MTTYKITLKDKGQLILSFYTDDEGNVINTYPESMKEDWKGALIPIGTKLIRTGEKCMVHHPTGGMVWKELNYKIEGIETILICDGCRKTINVAKGYYKTPSGDFCITCMEKRRPDLKMERHG